MSFCFLVLAIGILVVPLEFSLLGYCPTSLGFCPLVFVRWDFVRTTTSSYTMCSSYTEQAKAKTEAPKGLMQRNMSILSEIFFPGLEEYQKSIFPCQKTWISTVPWKIGISDTLCQACFSKLLA